MSPAHGPVLVVDDDAGIREALADSLRDEGYQVAEARDGRAALAWLHDHPAPSLIILDWWMTPMTGSEFLRQASEDESLPRVPVALFTAYKQGEEEARQFPALVECIHKPADLERLFQVVRRYCQL